MEAFPHALLALGGLLVLAGLSAGLARRSIFSLAAASVIAGLLLGSGGVGFLHLDARGAVVRHVSEIALVVILFRDGLEVDEEMLRGAWRLPLRKLALAMPLTAVLVALITRALTDLSWSACLLLGALLSPTDPILSSSVVTNPRVPRLVRHSLNLESGLNDGLALPAVIVFLTAVEPHPGHFELASFLAENLGLGAAWGLLVGAVAALLLPRDRLLPDVPAHATTLFGLGVGLGAYGLATSIPPHANGFIAVFVAAISLGVLRPALVPRVQARAEELVELVKVVVFVVFGAVLTLAGLLGDGWAAVGIALFTLLVARSVAVAVALLGTRTPPLLVGFMAFFGPKGIATVTFSLLVLADGGAAGERIFHIAALTVVLSVLLHGLSDTPASAWLGRRLERGGQTGQPTAGSRGQSAQRDGCGD